jgi:hypothetical protein
VTHPSWVQGERALIFRNGFVEALLIMREYLNCFQTAFRIGIVRRQHDGWPLKGEEPRGLHRGKSEIDTCVTAGDRPPNLGTIRITNPLPALRALRECALVSQCLASRPCRRHQELDRWR